MGRPKTAVVALGGNAISPKSEADTIANQFRHTRESLAAIQHLVEQGYHLAITHGNGPQVGNALLRVELARGKAPILPLGICVADVQGGMGYMIEQSLQNRLRQVGIARDVVTMVTQVVVDKDDPSLQDPTKFIGQFYTEEEAKRLAEESGWTVKYDEGRDGWRRVVASPMPKQLVNAQPIKQLVDHGTIVIAAGGGGIPVCIEENGDYEGVDAVIDKDRAAAIIGKDIEASQLFIVTDVPEVYLHYKNPNQEAIREISSEKLQSLHDAGHFPAGSMGPKIEAALSFLRNGGTKVVITSIDHLTESLTGNRGTHITV
ncbi:MAG: carbamate kinase [Candidatus Marinimicrobia bacterium]|nr:carbamate kinase [Candidatus Neomarinimicrobiota bacterium]MCF7827332.1 carbamate kinase [Candidatus Neomarinimicrobiota bacterium]MCF7881435.1 carbamate kinase [Candidatus Neomarinimicrobiota bacterium]